MYLPRVHKNKLNICIQGHFLPRMSAFLSAAPGGAGEPGSLAVCATGFVVPLVLIPPDVCSRLESCMSVQ